ncbi:hypothetical protein F2Q70_00038516 [Brassica cretica]|uniref:Uncharacterized protein n=1 Tax=Brassica cretica TaxID=69181 RepID=A0A8S9K752_BRACR|nr:hypothetical protein F2Q70_00038516 [Brassica cretica]
MKIISSVPKSRRFGLAASRPCLAFQVLFFAGAWLMPLISELPDMTCDIIPVEVARREQLQWAFPLFPCLDGSWPSQNGTP